MSWLFTALGFLLAAPFLAQAAETCAGCHADVTRTYRETGMGRSFARLQPGNVIEDFTTRNHYYHEASDTHYVMLERGGQYIQRRYQLGYDGKESNVDEKQIDFVMGSGTHARTYLHRTPAGTLVQLPLGWYAEKGGYWAMSPGYDTPIHPGSQRAIGYDCMFCHNAYPQTPAVPDRFANQPIFTGPMPEGIDCERCHGSGDKHVAAARAPGATAASIRQTITNPARLSSERQLEVCMQCHLQPNSFRPTLEVKRYGRNYFSYEAGEPLSNFMLYFDTPDEKAADRFQITSSAYRLRQSACFLKSQGSLQCTTCHNPHTGAYSNACQKCHTSAFQAIVRAGQHTSATNCIDCHMPKRRTQDVVHVVMTDHYIQRRPPAVDLLAEMPERHEAGNPSAQRPATPYYPAKLPPTADNRLALAVAQIREQADNKADVLQLSRLLQAERPAYPDPYFELAEASQLKEAVVLYKEALRRDPKYLSALLALGQRTNSLEVLKRATEMAPSDARPWASLGQFQLQSDHLREAEAAFLKALTLDPDLSQPHVGLGIVRARAGAAREAETEFREAIRIDSSSGAAHANLANLLNLQNDLAQAAWEFERSVHFEPGDLWTRLNFGALLYTLHRTQEAQQQAEAALKIQSQSADAHHLLGNILEQKGNLKEAVREYEETVRLQPQTGRAQLDLGAVLAQTGDRVRAAQHLKLAAASDNPNVRRIALQLLEELH